MYIYTCIGNDSYIKFKNIRGINMKNYLFTENDLDEYNKDMMECVLTQLKTDWINSDIICKNVEKK